MYTLPKKDGGYWLIRLVSNNTIQFRSLSRRMAQDWYDENETEANKARNNPSNGAVRRKRDKV